MTNCNRKISQYSEYTGLTPSDLIFPVVDTSIYSNFNLPYDNLVAAIQGSLSGSGIFQTFITNISTSVITEDAVKKSGDTMTGNLTVPNLLTAGLVDGVDVSVFNVDFTSHTGNTNNPHSVTASQINAYTKTETDQWLASKISHSASTAVNDFLVGSGSNTFIKKTLNETKAILGIGHSLTSSTINTTTNSVTDVALANMYVIPGAGTYIVWFISTYSNSNDNQTTTFSIYANNSLISNEPMLNPAANTLYPVHVLNTVTVIDDQAIEIRWKASANTSTCWSRTLILIKIA